MCIDWIETLAEVQHNRERSNNTKMNVCVCVCEGDRGSVENKMQEEEQPSKAIKNSRCTLS